MTVSIDWFAFIQVFVAAMLSATVAVTLYAVGLRLLVIAGRAPVVTPAEFTDAITVITPKEAKRAAKAAAKAAKRSPLTAGQKRAAFLGALTAFGLCSLVVLAGIGIIVFFH